MADPSHRRFLVVSSSISGWNEVAEKVRVLQAEHPGAFIATTTYGTAAQLGFALRDADVVALSPRHDQFDYWFDPAAHAGRDAIIIADPFYSIAETGSPFERVTLVDQMQITGAGKLVYEPQIYFAEGYVPPVGRTE